MRAKARRAPIAAIRSSPLAAKFGDQVHMDVWGPASILTTHRDRYVLTLVDDATCWLSMPLLKTKGDAFAKFKSFEAFLLTHYDTHIKTLHCDRGGEFLSDAMRSHLDSKGMVTKLTIHNTPKHNGVAERTHGMVLNGVRTLFAASGLPRFLWGEALQYIVYIHNRTPWHALNGKTPYEARFGTPPDLSNMHKWGCKVYITMDANSKLDARAVEARWVGLDTTSNGHWIYWPSQRKISVERNVVFSKDGARVEGEYHDIEIRDAEPISSISPQLSDDEPIEKRSRKPSQKIRDIMAGDTVASLANEDNPTLLTYAMASATSPALGFDPRTVNEAMKRPDWDSWHDAMKDEIRRLESRNSWSYAYPPPKANVIGSKW
ncbi:hypothetical protein AX17_006627, partial [Amanita inopinata Kibby_2008]